MRPYCIILFAIWLSLGCRSDCEHLPTHYESYHSAIKIIRSSDFKIEKSLRSPRSSWVSRAEYYSCDGEQGYFIYHTQKGDSYLHEDVPYHLWRSYENAPSKGTFINEKLKGRYRFTL